MCRLLSKQLDYSLNSLITSGSGSSEDFVDVSLDAEEQHDMDFSQYLKGNFAAELYLGGGDTSSTDLFCGAAAIPCRTINIAVSHIPDSEKCRPRITDSVTVSGHLKLNRAIVESASPELAEVMPDTTSSLRNNEEMTPFISVAKNVTFDRIHFVLIAAFAKGFSSVMFIMDEAHLMVIDGEFCSSNQETMNVDAPLFRVSSNSELTLKKMSVAALSLPSSISSLIDSDLLGTSPAKVIIESTSFMNSEHNGDTAAILSSSSLGVTIKDSEFKGISSNRESGAVLTLSGEPIRANCIFDGILNIRVGSRNSLMQIFICVRGLPLFYVWIQP